MFGEIGDRLWGRKNALIMSIVMITGKHRITRSSIHRPYFTENLTIQFTSVITHSSFCLDGTFAWLCHIGTFFLCNSCHITDGSRSKRRWTTCWELRYEYRTEYDS